MVITIKYYLVDSENVNDNWLLLLDMMDQEDQIIIFYTKNSPHMSYASVIKLLNLKHPIQFEECHEGNNALDFQLISYLGYLMKNSEVKDSQYIIMSNDTGFDPAVKFWKERNFPVNRINVNYCKLHANKQEAASALPAIEALKAPSAQSTQTARAAATEPVKERPKAKPAKPAKSAKSVTSAYDFNKKEVDMFINCLGKDNLVGIHETLVHVYGQKQGQNIYKAVKEKTYPLEEINYKRADKVKNYADIIFSHSDIKEPGNFVDFLEKNKDKAKNLNGIRSAIVKAYGDGNGMKYYSLFKPYFKMISALK